MGKSILALTNCGIVDLDGEGAVRPGSTILVARDGRGRGVIESVDTRGGARAPAGAEILDLGGAFVLPGLINAHAHLAGSGRPMKALGGGASRKRLAAFLGTAAGKRILFSMMRSHAADELYSGVTTLRCVGDLHFFDIRLRDGIEAGRYIGPRIIASGPGLCITGGHGSGGFSLECDSPWEARKLARANIREGADLIKVFVTGGVTDGRKVGEAGRPQMTLEEVAAACEEAHKAGLPVAAHAQSAEGLRIALAGGVDTIEHGAALDDGLVALFKRNPRSLRGFSSYVATIYPSIPLARFDPTVTKTTAIVSENNRIVMAGMIEGAKRARAEGISLGFGTDASCPYVTHYGTWRELCYEAAYLGLGPAEVLRAATIGNARLLGIAGETGSIEPGKAADLIVAERNPLEDLRALSSLRCVIARGRVFDRPAPRRIRELDEALDAIPCDERGVPRL